MTTYSIAFDSLLYWSSLPANSDAQVLLKDASIAGRTANWTGPLLCWYSGFELVFEQQPSTLQQFIAFLIAQQAVVSPSGGLTKNAFTTPCCFDTKTGVWGPQNAPTPLAIIPPRPVFKGTVLLGAAQQDLATILGGNSFTINA